MIYTVKNTSEIGKPVRVFVDGTEIDGVIEADTDAGYVIACVIGHDGKILIDGGELKAERIEGVVTVEPI